MQRNEKLFQVHSSANNVEWSILTLPYQKNAASVSI